MNTKKYRNKTKKRWDRHTQNKHTKRARSKQYTLRHQFLKLDKFVCKIRRKRFSIWRMEFFHPAMRHVALEWHATESAKMSAILEFYFWFRFRPYHRSRHVILHQSAKFYPNRTALGRKQMTSCRFSRWRISAILGSLKSPCDFL